MSLFIYLFIFSLKHYRKALPTWRSQVKVGAESGFEAPLDDGYSWRKYGQKDILGAKYPRLVIVYIYIYIYILHYTHIKIIIIIIHLTKQS